MKYENRMNAIEALQAAQASIRKEYNDEKGLGADSQILAERICKSFQNAFDKPPVDEFEQILQKNFTEDEVRLTLFAPREEQIKYYPILLLSGCTKEVRNLGETHPLVRLKALVLSTIFLLHRHNWKNFLEEFIIRGGLITLSEMLNEPNLYFRGQVVEIFLTITDCDKYDWFQIRSDVIGRTLHIRLLELSDNESEGSYSNNNNNNNNSSFLQNLISNRQHSYPGGSMRCLQIMAFWLSWVRAMYTKNQQLNLSYKLLNELDTWRKNGPIIDGAIDVSDRVTEGGGDASANDSDVVEVSNHEIDQDSINEEKKLAETLYKDFGTDQYQRKDDELSDVSDATLPPHFPQSSKSKSESESESESESTTLSVSGIARPLVDDEIKNLVKEVFERIDDKIEFKSNSSNSSSSITINKNKNKNEVKQQLSQIELDQIKKEKILTAAKIEEDNLKSQSGKELRERGNGAFGRGDYLEAIKLYDYALNSIQLDNDNDNDNNNNENKNLKAALHFNSAACYWKIYQKKESKQLGSNDNSDNNNNEYMDHSLLQRINEWGWSNNEILFFCEKHCKDCLNIDNKHYKAGYRLGAVLLAKGDCSQALDVIERSISILTIVTKDLALFTGTSTGTGTGGNTNTNTTTETSYLQLKELRTRCLAAKFLEKDSITKNENGNENDNDKNKNMKSSNNEERGLSKRAAKVLAALQIRKQRENNRETHALSSSWVAPVTEETSSSTSVDDSSSVKLEKKKKSVRVQHDDESVIAYFGNSNVYTGKKDSITSSSDKKSSSSSSIDSSSKSSVKNSVDEVAAAALKLKKNSEKKILKKSLTEKMTNLKKQINIIELSNYSQDCIEKNRKNMLLLLNDLWLIPVSISNKSKFHTLSSALEDTCSTLEEGFVITMILFSQVLCSNTNNTDTDADADVEVGKRCIIELTNISRFSSIFSMALFGNDNLRIAASDLVTILQGNSNSNSNSNSNGNSKISDMGMTAANAIRQCLS